MESVEKDVEKEIIKLRKEIGMVQEKIETLHTRTDIPRLYAMLRDDYYEKLDELKGKLKKLLTNKAEIVAERVQELLKKLKFAAIHYYNGVALDIFVVSDGHLVSTRRYKRLHRGESPNIKFYARLAGQLASTLDKLTVEKLYKVIKMLRENGVVPYFRDYRDGLVIFEYGEQYEVIPLSSTGEGFQALLELLPPVLLGSKVLVIEEPEIHLHPGFMEKYSSTLLKISKKCGVQFIMSTHSIEFLRNLITDAKEMNMLDELNVIRMYRHYGTGVLDYEILSGKEAYEELEELGGDLRGP